MGTISNLTINDGTSALTLIPKKSGEVSMWVAQTANVPLRAQRNVKLVTPEQKAGALQKVRLRVEMPILETVSGTSSAGYTAPPKVAHVPACDCTFIFSERATEAERTALYCLVQSTLSQYLLGTATVNTSTTQIGEAIYKGIAPY